MGYTLSYSSELIIEPTPGAQPQPYLIFRPNVTANSRVPVTGFTISYSSELMAEPTLGAETQPYLLLQTNVRANSMGLVKDYTYLQ